MTHRRLVALVVLLMATAVSSWAVASPNGLGSEADQGCLCHTPEASTSVRVEGLPEAFDLQHCVCAHPHRQQSYRTGGQRIAGWFSVEG